MVERNGEVRAGNEEGDRKLDRISRWCTAFEIWDSSLKFICFCSCRLMILFRDLRISSSDYWLGIALYGVIHGVRIRFSLLCCNMCTKEKKLK